MRASCRSACLLLLAALALLLLAGPAPAGGEGGGIGPGEDFGDYSAEYGEEGEGEMQDSEDEAEKGPEQHMQGVLELDELTFDKVVDGSKKVFVQFYAHWCPNSKAMIEDMKAAGEELAKYPDMLIAKVNTEKQGKIGERFDIDGYPTLKVFEKGSIKPEEYDGETNAQAIVEYMISGTKAGTVKKLEGLVKAFMHQPTERERVADMMAEAVKDLEKEDAKSGAYYVKVMSNTIKRGDDYISKEVGRLKRVIDAGGLKPEKATELKKKINVLNVFDASTDS